jgi:hypothetical protein
MLKEEPERYFAHSGFSRVVPYCQEAALEHFPFLCSCLCFYKTESVELEQRFREILQGMKQLVQQQQPDWNGYISMFPQSL